MRKQRTVNNFYVLYRISDNGFKSKIKPQYVTKYNCLKNALDTFLVRDNVYFYVYVDAVIEETDRLIHQLCDNRKNVEIIYLDCKNGAMSLRKVYEKACTLNDDDFVYLLEDDYIHLPNSLDALMDFAECNYTDYVTLYDHPDKYDIFRGRMNPYVKSFGEYTILFHTKTCHWKITNSTTMTFAAFADVLKRDKDLFWQNTADGYPHDFETFLELGRTQKFVSSPVPSLSTHGEVAFLAPFVDWEKYATRNYKCCVVFPCHKEKLNDDEEKSFMQMLKVFGGRRAIKVVIPDNISSEYYDKYNNLIEVCKVKSEWMSSRENYNAMCCNKEFYEMFIDYDYILKYEPDAWVFEDRLDYFMNLGYDYYGAPWPHHNNTVGNSGLSLRKVSKVLELTTKYNYHKDSLLGNCDTWFCLTHKDELNTCDLETACNFSIEILTPLYLRLIRSHPMGLHGRDMKVFWDEDGEKFKELKENNLKQ